jgi:hypothetical protein
MWNFEPYKRTKNSPTCTSRSPTWKSYNQIENYSHNIGVAITTFVLANGKKPLDLKRYRMDKPINSNANYWYQCFRYRYILYSSYSIGSLSTAFGY